MGMFDTYDLPGENVFDCSHSSTYIKDGVLHCTSCNAVYDETSIDWVYPEEGEIEEVGL